MTELLVDVVSDVMCPWCFIGKKRLEKALAEIGEEIAVTIHWRPYQLDPHIAVQKQIERLGLLILGKHMLAANHEARLSQAEKFG